ncbi:MAG: hypothetical protein ABI570_04690, partial [Ilumatobacteraceae bacterium]
AGLAVTMIAHRVDVMTDQLQADHVEKMTDHLVVVKNVHVRIAHIAVVTTDQVPDGQVPDGQVPVDRFAVEMTDHRVVEKTVAIFLPVRKLPHNERPMKFIIAPVVESTARSRCLSPNIRLSVGATTVR